MRWSERQLAMLREMGISLRWREAPAGDASGAAEGDPARVAPAGVPRPQPATERTGPQATAGSPDATVADATATDTRVPTARLASAEWLVVGDAFTASDATSADEERLLDNMLAAIGLARAAPAREQRAAFVSLPEPGAGEARQGFAWLDAAVDAVRPSCILALGRAAAQAVLDTDEPLGALRGRRETRAGVPVIVTFSPAFLLRHPADKAKAWADLCLAVRCLEEAG
jgi:uracil-DNA glycosylase